MRRWARGQLHKPPQNDSQDDTTDEAAVAFGLQVVEPDEDDATDADSPAICYLWPCNVAMYQLWGQLQTQWIVSMHGREGLNYQSVLCYLRTVAHIRPRRIPEVVGCIQILERAALEVWNAQRAQQQLEQEQQRQQSREQ